MSRETITLRSAGRFVVLDDPRIAKQIAMHYQAAIEFAAALRSAPAGSAQKFNRMHIICDLQNVHLVAESGFVVTFPISVIPQIVAGVRHLARKAEEIDKAEEIIRDNAVMSWMGLPLGLSDNPEIRAATRTEAEKFCGTKRPPGAIEPRSIVGTPAIANLGAQQ